jgi:hypothetical protein
MDANHLRHPVRDGDLLLEVTQVLLEPGRVLGEVDEDEALDDVAADG